MQNIPYDIIINNIIPYTYNIQSNLLLEDIKNYFMIKSKIMDYKYYSTSIKLEIVAYFYFKNMLNNILNRHFIINLKQYNYNNIKNFSIEKRFNILFGLLFILSSLLLILIFIITFYLFISSNKGGSRGCWDKGRRRATGS